ncbi:MAG TPA: PfkB family carbohydrate kinase, partial [Verrucomicrobiaceae bacterium]
MKKDSKEGDFRRKIKTREQLVEAIGTRPRAKTVVMCHGTFDLVHPGHVRHLIYAKDKADILVASLTSDAHINKANFRPFVPQDLRAMNLAALECVDYVIIDDEVTPLANLKFIQPDIFAKGYEYSAEGIHPKTREEMEVLESFGGQLLFTPGDLVLSSSAIIEATPPNLAIEKLLALLQSEGLGFEDLRQALARLQGIKVHVVGDTIVDSYTYCSLIGGTAKTPTFSVKFERQVDYAGGAAVVAKHLRQAGADVIFSTVLGDDEMGKFVVQDLEAAGVVSHVITDRTRPTTQKNAFITNGY